MQIQVNTDDHVEGREGLIRHVEEETRAVLGRFSDHITRVEVHLGDENAGKSGANDKRCAMEARLAGRRPETVTHNADTLESAFKEAARKLRRMLESSLGRVAEHKGAPSIRKEVQL